MRRLATAERVRLFIRRLAPSAIQSTTIYLTGGATAVLLGWRDATIDIDIKVVPNDGSVLRGIPPLKEALELNVELASPDLFLPVRAGWEGRSPWETTSGLLVVRHFDPTAQALGKLERGHARDLVDVAELFRRGYVTPTSLNSELDAIEDDLYRFPAVDPPSLRRVAAAAIRRWA
ncbi:MAG: DUF6036 family nucleotidyltransferase [Acidimicrobiales bacterium]